MHFNFRNQSVIFLETRIDVVRASKIGKWLRTIGHGQSMKYSMKELFGTSDSESEPFQSERSSGKSFIAPEGEPEAYSDGLESGDMIMPCEI